MLKKKICFIAQFPPPIHGLSKAVDTLYNSKLNQKFNFSKIDISNNKKFLQTIKMICENDADLFYFTISQTKGGNLRDLIILKILELKRKKCLVHLHGGYYRNLIENDVNILQKKLNYKAISKVSGTIVLSERLIFNFKDMIEDKKIYAVANCIDDNFLLSDKEFQEKLKLVEKKEILNVLYLSNFIKSKGYPEVLQLACMEKERCSSGNSKRLHFNFAGKFFSDKEKVEFFEFIKENKLEDYVTYHGVVDGKEKKELLKKNDLFILLTRYPNEGQPISIIEAMGNGLTIITTNHAGIPDIIEDGLNGIVVEEKIDLSNIYKELNSNRKKLAFYMQNNRRKCINNFTEVKYLSCMCKLFEQI